MFDKTRAEHCVKSVQIRSICGPYFSVIGLNTEIYSVSLRIQPDYGKNGVEKTPYWDTFHGVEQKKTGTRIQK